MKLILILLFTFKATAGLPPTSSKITGESAYSTTFKTDFGTFTGTRSGTALTLNGIGAASGTSLVLGGTINANALLDVQSTTKAFMPPRMTTTQKNAIASPTAGMMVYDSTLSSGSVYNGSSWTNYLATTATTGNATEFSASVAQGTGTITKQNLTWLASCTVANPARCTFTGGIFTVAPNCFMNNGDGSPTIAVSTASVTSTYVDVQQSSTGYQFNILCQKVGVDYVAAVNLGIVANTLAGYAQIPGVSGTATPNVDTFSVSYGTTNATTACSADPCSYLGQLGGTAVSSIGWTATGKYKLNTARTYTSLMCNLNSYGTGGVYSVNGESPINCTSCATAAFTTVTRSGGAYVDTIGTLMCQGTY